MTKAEIIQDFTILATNNYRQSSTDMFHYTEAYLRENRKDLKALKTLKEAFDYLYTTQFYKPNENMLHQSPHFFTINLLTDKLCNYVDKFFKKRASKEFYGNN